MPPLWALSLLLPAGAEDLAAAVRMPTSGIRVLSVADNHVGDEGALSFAMALRDNASLDSLDLQGNQIGDRGAAGLAEVLSTNRALRRLLLPHNLLRCQGFAALAATVATNGTLESLDVSFNQVADSGATALALALPQNSSLTDLDLAGNQIGGEGGAAIAAALRAPPGELRYAGGGGGGGGQQLRRLNLNDNQVGDVAAIEFAKTLASGAGAQEGPHPGVHALPCTGQGGGGGGLDRRQLPAVTRCAGAPCPKFIEWSLQIPDIGG
jgi:hypothetical protein